MLAERAPASLEKQDVADCQPRLSCQLLTLALDSEDDEVAAVGHHPRVDDLADEPRAGRNHHFC